MSLLCALSPCEHLLVLLMVMTWDVLVPYAALPNSFSISNSPLEYDDVLVVAAKTLLHTQLF